MTEEVKADAKQNGIKRPAAGSVTGKLWDIADEISKSLGRPAPRKAVVDRYMAEVENANQATANTQYARWVTYHGASETLRQLRIQETEERRNAKSSERDSAKAEREAAKAAKAAEKEAAKQAKDAEKASKKEAAEAERKARAEQREAEKKAKAEAREAERAAKAAEKAAKTSKPEGAEQAAA